MLKKHEYLILWQDKPVGWFKDPGLHFIYMEGLVELFEEEEHARSFKNIVKDFVLLGRRSDDLIRVELHLNGNKEEITHGVVNNLEEDNLLSIRRVYEKKEIDWLVSHVN